MVKFNRSHNFKQHFKNMQSTMRPNFMEKPIKLVSFDSLGHAILHEQALAFLQALPKPISIVCAVGPVSTGKSYLLNQIVCASRKSSFQVSDNSSQTSTGMEVWGKPLLSVNEKGEVTNVVLIDTQGISEAQCANNGKIIALALLISNVFIYNSQGPLEKESLKQFQLITDIAHRLQRPGNDLWLTDFHWVLRDLQAGFTNQLGSSITSHEYLQKSISEFSEPSSKIGFKYFRNSYCHAFIHPFNEQDEQKPAFTEQLLKFKKILQTTPSVDFDGNFVGQILQTYVNGLNQNLSFEELINQRQQCIARRESMRKFQDFLVKISLKNGIDSCEKFNEIATEMEKQICQSYREIDPFEKNLSTLENSLKIIKEDYLKDYENSNLIKTKKRSSHSHSHSHSKSKQSFKISRKELKLSFGVVQEDLVSDKKLKNSQRRDSSALMRIRQDLEAKLHRYELELKDLKEQNAQISAELVTLHKDKQTLLESLEQIKEEQFLVEKKHTGEKLRLEEENGRVREQKLFLDSQIKTVKQLYDQKVEFLEEKLANLELQQQQSEQELIKKYTGQIDFLQKEIEETAIKHQRQIEEVKATYRQCIHCGEGINQYDEQGVCIPQKLRADIKAYQQSIEELREKNYQNSLELQALSTELQHALEEKENLINSHQLQMDSLEKRQKESEKHQQDIFDQKIAGQDQLIAELTEKLDRLIREKQDGEKCWRERESRYVQQTAEMEQEYGHKLEDCRAELMDMAKETQRLQQILEEKQREQAVLSNQLEQSKQILADSCRDETLLKQVRREYESKIQQIHRNRQSECEQLKNNVENLSKELENAQEKYNNLMEERNNLHSIELERNENKIQALNAQIASHSAIFLENQQLKEECDELDNRIADLQAQIQALSHQNHQLQTDKTRNQQQNKKLQNIIHQLNSTIKQTKSQLHELLSQQSTENTTKQSKYFELLDRYHQKQKQYCLLQQNHQGVLKTIQTKDKEAEKQKNHQEAKYSQQIEDMEKQQTRIRAALQETETILIKAQKDNCILEQKCEYLGQQIEMNENKADKEREKEFQRSQNTANALQSRMKHYEKSTYDYLRKIELLEREAEETTVAIAQMNKTYQTHCGQYESNARLLRRRTRQCETENKLLKAQIEALIEELKALKQTKNMIEDNYQADFQLWAGKLETYETSIKELQAKRF